MLNQLNLPLQWQEEYTKYPGGFTIFESICEWVTKVNLMVDHLNLTQVQIDKLYSDTLPENVQTVLQGWYDSGALVDILADNYSRINPKQYGCIMDGSADDTLALQSAVDDAIFKGKEVFIPPKARIRITQPLVISAAVKILGGGKNSSYLIADGCDGIHIDAGVTSLTMEGFCIGQPVRYTTTPNVFRGIVINGTTASRPYNHTYRDIYIDGFETAILCNWLWASLFNSVTCDFGHKGIIALGTSVNNKIDGNSQFSVDGTPGSRGIVLGDGINPIEGWWLIAPLVYNASVAIEGIGANHVYLVKPMLDFCLLDGILIRNSGTNFGTNWNIEGGYIAFYGPDGEAAIKLGNSIANAQQRGAEISNVEILTYAGASLIYGILITDIESHHNNIIGNKIKLQDGGADIYINGGNNHIIMGNNCMTENPGAGGNNIYIASGLTGTKVGMNIGSCNVPNSL